MKKLESLIPGNSITSINVADAVIIDANAKFHMLKPPCGEITYTSMAESFMLYTLGSSRGISGATLLHIHVVFDLNKVSKVQLEIKRTGGSQANIYHLQPDFAIPKDWTMFLSRAENKESLAKCYTDSIISKGPNKVRPQENKYLSGENDTICHVVRPNDCLFDAVSF